MSDCYILIDRIPVIAQSLAEWARWSTRENITVAKTETDFETIETIFIGVNVGHKWGDAIFFETRVFHGPLDGEFIRYATWELAEAGHKKMVKRCEDEHAKIKNNI